MEALLSAIAFSVSSIVTKIDQLLTTLIAMVSSLTTIKEQVSAPAQRGEQFRHYSSLFEMLESKIEWVGSKLDSMEARGMSENFQEHELVRQMCDTFSKWKVSSVDTYFERIFEQRYDRLWVSRRRSNLRWHPTHEQYLKVLILEQLFVHEPDTEHKAKMGQLMESNTWSEFKHIVYDWKMIEQTLEFIQTELVAKDLMKKPIISPILTSI